MCVVLACACSYTVTRTVSVLYDPLMSHKTPEYDVLCIRCWTAVAYTHASYRIQCCAEGDTQRRDHMEPSICLWTTLNVCSRVFLHCASVTFYELWSGFMRMWSCIMLTWCDATLLTFGASQISPVNQECSIFAQLICWRHLCQT